MENTAKKVLATGVAMVAGGVVATSTTQVDVHADQVNDDTTAKVNTKGMNDLVIHLDSSANSEDIDDGTSFEPVDPGDGGDTTNPGDNGGSVTPIEPETPSNGEKPAIPDQVVTNPGVNNAVTKYNQALSSNGGDSSAQDVVQAKASLDEAIEKALPSTAVSRNDDSQKKNGFIGAILIGASALATALGLLIKKQFGK
ncbi:hypothetical protein G7084_00495 [Weissella coleopterorum]|uniref:Gram-positive cocci surface proteins LPxTG domain-containing protein n=1 Tax=Weissella coleopterorum TaxID=2714949 RepID=A0A6G8AY59_9LACO|nr:hypothetical protein [Weissella coleopterorum]QIL49936.1 hypothetical protein G7084_00495 [Weissella coleopterorum]